MNTDQLLEKIEKLIEPIRTQLYEQGANIVRVVQGQRRLEQGQAQIKTVLETLEAGQKDIRETMATKADIQDLKAKVVRKIKQHDKRVDALEEKEGIHNTYKN